MTDRQSTFIVGFDGDAGNLNSVIAAFKSSVKSAVADLQATASKLDLFANLQQDVKNAGDTFEILRDQAAALRAQFDALKASGATVGDDLAAGLKAADAAAKAAGKTYETQTAQLQRLDAQLRAAGVDTSKLAAEQTRLAASLKEATAAAAQQSAKDLLGFKSLGDVQPQINALNKAFDTLRASGKLSGTEIAAAQALLTQKLQDTRGQVTGLTSAFQAQRTVLSNLFSSAAAPILGIGAAIGVVANAVGQVTQASHDFENELANIGATTNISAKELEELGESARQLSVRLGVDVIESLKALRTLLAAGIDPGQALQVLEISANAAKASLSDIGDTAKLSAQLVNGFGVQVDGLTHAIDVLFQAQKDGGPSLQQFSEGLGQLLPVAKQLNIPLEELTATLTVMTKATQDAPLAFSDLQKVLLKLNTQDARNKLQGLGIDVHGLIDTLQQFGAKNIGIDQLADIGLASSKSAKAFAELTSAAGGAADELKRLQDVAEPTKKALDIIDQSPAQRLKLFQAALTDLNTALGETIGQSSKLAVVAASLLNDITALVRPSKDAADGQTQLGRAAGFTGLGLGTLVGALAAVNLALSLFKSSQTDAVAQLTALNKAAVDSGAALSSAVAGIRSAVEQQLAAVSKQITDARGSLVGFTDDLQKVIAQSQASTQAAIADLNARAKAQLDALDKSVAAEKDTADQVIAIQTQLAADRLAAITKGQDDILAAIKAEGDARIKAAQLAGQKTADIERTVGLQVAQLSLEALQKIQGQYTAHVATLVALEQGYVAQLNQIDQTRVSFNEDIQTKLTAIRREGLSDFDSYIAKVGDINTLLAKAQAEFDKGGVSAVALGKKYTDQALGLADSLRTVVNENGTEIVSAFDLQQTKIGIVTKAADQYNKALDAQAESAQRGANAAVDSLDQVRAKLKDVTDQVDALSAKVGAGIKVKIDFDTSSIANLNATIDAALAEQKHLLDVQVDVGKLQTQVKDLVANLKAGITEGTDAQLDQIAGKLGDIAEKAKATKINLNTADAIEAVSKVANAVQDIEKIKPKLTIDSNAADVQKDIDKLKEPTESTHTIHVVLDKSGLPSDTQGLPVPGFALGGAVGSLQRAATTAQRGWHAFAAGGPVFPNLSGPKVPGIGFGDTVPAALERGSFVVRKAASQFYGDAAMMRLIAGATVRRFAAGGPVKDLGGGVYSSDDSSKESPFYGDIPAGTTKSDRNVGEIDPPQLPSDPKQRDNVIRQYIFDVAYAAIADDYFYWKPALRVMNSLLSQYDDHKSDQNQDEVLQQARSIGLNLGVTKGTHTGFDVDGRKWHKELAQNIPAGLGGPLSYIYSFYAKGGATGSGPDKVNALLTPGEFVVKPAAVNLLGENFFHMINSMKVPKDAVADFASAMSLAPPPRPVRFAEGGMVGDSGPAWSGGSATWQQGKPGGATNGYGGVTYNTFNLNASAQDLFSIDNVRRILLPVLREIDRRSPK